MFINRQFTYLFVASMISVLGGSFSYIALGWTFSKEMGTLVLSLLMTTYFVARFVFFLTLGPFTDRYQPKKLMINTMLFRAALLILFAGLLYLKISYWWFFIVMVALAAAETLYTPASSKLIVRIVKKDDLSRANAMLNLTDRIGIFVGMLLGATAISMLPFNSILLMEGIAYLLGAGLLGLIVVQAVEPGSAANRHNFIQEWKEGFKYIASEKWLLGLVALGVFSNIAIAPAVTMLAPFANTVLQGDSTVFSYLEMAGIAGSIVSGMILSKFRITRLAFFFFVACFGEAIFMMFFGLNHVTIVAILLLVLNGAAVAVFNIPFSTLMQRYIPDHIMGRARSTVNALCTGASSLGYLCTGFVSENMGIDKTFVVFSGIGMAGIFVVMLIRPFKGLEEKNLAGNTTGTEVASN